MDIRVDDAVTGRPKQIGVVHRNVATELVFDEGAQSLEVAKRLVIGDSTGELVLGNAGKPVAAALDADGVIGAFDGGRGERVVQVFEELVVKGVIADGAPTFIKLPVDRRLDAAINRGGNIGGVTLSRRA